MNYSELPNNITKRDAAILEAASAGLLTYELVPIVLGRLTVYAVRDGVRLDGCRLGMSARGQAELLDRFELMLHTPRTAEAQARKALDDGGLVGPFTRSALGITSDTESMSADAVKRHSDRIDAALPPHHEGCVSSWKRRVLSLGLWSHPGRQAHIGWWLRKGTPNPPAPTFPALTEPELVLINRLMFGHSANFGDYSELVDGICWWGEIDDKGEIIDLREVVMGKHGAELALELSHEGVLPDWRPPYASTHGQVIVPPASQRVLRLTTPYMRGDDVAEVQRVVDVKPDRVFGPDTQAAVKAFQRGRGLLDNGVVDTQTWEALKKADKTPAIVTGMDVSVWQKPSDMDWPRLAADHRFVIARACYGVRPDKVFDKHVAGARDAGMLVGGYVFYRQTQPWREQLDAFVAQLGTVGFDDGDILPAVDLEWNKQYDGPLDVAKHNSSGRALVEALAERFGGALVYLAPGFYQRLGEPAWLLEHEWWLAHFTSAPKPWCPWKDWAIWQHTGKGKIAGYSGAAIDLNRARRVPVVEAAAAPDEP